MTSPAPVPSVTATAGFDPGNLSPINLVYMVDLPDSLVCQEPFRLGRHFHTTCSATAADGTIPFDTAFGSGTGRPFKIVEARPQ